MRWLFLAPVAVLLSGCVLPAAVSIALIAADVSSYAISGKTVTDHGLSLAMQEDCAILRVLEGKLCQETETYETAIATLTPLPADVDTAVASQTPTIVPATSGNATGNKQSTTVYRPAGQIQQAAIAPIPLRKPSQNELYRVVTNARNTPTYMVATDDPSVFIASDFNGQAYAAPPRRVPQTASASNFIGSQNFITVISGIGTQVYNPNELVSERGGPFVSDPKARPAEG